MSTAKILLLTLSWAINSSAWAQFAFNIPDRSDAKIESYSGILVEVEGKLALCSHSDKGSVFLNVAGGVPPYNFKWNTKETSQNRTDLNAGTYTVLITDSEGTEFIQRVVIQPPFPLILNPVEKKDASCGSGNDGYAKISVKVGRNDYEEDSPPYHVRWSNGLENVWEAQGLAPGTYTVVVTDKYNCDASISFDIQAASEGIQVTESIQTPNCGSSDSGKIALDVTGGVAPYQYTWSNGAKTKDLTNIASGTYQVLVTDSKGCSFQASYSLNSTESLAIESKIKEPSCQGSSDGEIELKTITGKGPFNYLWSSGQTTSEISGLSPGNYSVKIADASGCIMEKQFSLMNQSGLSLEVLENRPVSCSGEADGGISLKLVGAKGAYSLTWSDGIQDLLQRRDLEAGTYTITATDETGCAAVMSVAVKETVTIQAKIETALDVDCASGKTVGVAWVSIQGGREPYSIQWSNSSSNSREINFNEAGVLKVTVTDALGCVIGAELEVDFPNQSTQGARLDFDYRKLTITSEPEVLIREKILFESEIASEIIAWEWEFGDGSKSTEKDPVHVFSKAGEFEVKLTGYDLFGCSTVESNIVQVNSPAELVVIPNAFSPNGDKLNDTFKPKLRGISSFQLEVFNTWGEILFHTSSQESDGWDGTYKGQLAPAGNFLYQITYTTLDGQSINRTGGITLIR
jgi:gliding motility-associated-like protein